MPYSTILSDETFAKLQALAKPFVDTPESLISALADEELKRRVANTGGYAVPMAEEQLRSLDPDKHESLTHARLFSATVDGRALHRPKWNNLLDHLHVVGRQRLGSFEALQSASGARIKQGRYEKNGFHYLPEADISIQGLDANLAWDHSLGLARRLHVPIEVKFEWRDKQGAAHPGQVAILQWSPSHLAVG